MSATVCNHGFWLSDCVLCEKREGECDYGDCTEQATARTVYISLGRVTEARLVCEAHVTAMACAVPNDMRTETRRDGYAIPQLTGDAFGKYDRISLSEEN